MPASKYPLPTYRHLPGINLRPEDGQLQRIAADALAKTESATAAENPPWKYGLELVRHEYFWEAHEVMEPVWLHAQPNSAERHLVQGVIQLANAGLKARMGRSKAALRLAEMALELLEKSAQAQHAKDARVMGVDLTEARDKLREFKVALNEGGSWSLDLTVFWNI